MKTRLLLAVVGLAIALPSFGQQQNAPDPQLREQIVAIGKTFDDGFMNGDATALAALYTEDGVLVNDSGPIFGREVIEKWYEIVFRNVQFIKHSGTLDEQSPSSIGTSGNELWATGEWSQTVKGPTGPLDEKGYWTNIYTREGDVWKVRVSTWNRRKVY
jgi:ketosteroid isomerase-like protein